MSIPERKDYIDSFYGNSGPHEIIATIAHVRADVLQIRAEYFFLPAENRVIEFKLCRDADLNNLGSTGFLDKIGKEQVQNYCYHPDRNFKKGDSVTCQIVIQTNINQIDKGYYLTFYIKSLEHFDYQKIGDVYQKYKITYEPGRLYELRRDSTEELEIFVCKDINEKFRQIFSEGADSIEAQNAEISTLELRAADISSGIEKLSAEYEEKRLVEKQKLSDELSEARQQMQEELEQEKSELEREISRRREALAYLEKFGVPLEPPDVEIKNYADEDLMEFEYFYEMLNYWQSFLYHGKENLYYDGDILASLYLGLQTDQLILLSGNPGTGKTSLARNLSKSFGFEDTAIIPVQSNWADKSDLLGYYNPLDKTYVATPFLDALLDFCEKARTQPPEKLFIICLDEMNLAHVENYFAEFLSKLQDDRKIYLYSENLRRDMEAELQAYGKQEISKLTPSKLEYHFKLQRMANMLAKYPASFYIPTNIKFIGTLNQDETTFDLSPKVLDRSYVIRLEMNDDDSALDKADGDYTKPLRYIFLENYKPLEGFSFSYNAVKDFVKEMRRFASISNRVAKKIIVTEKFSCWWDISDIFILDYTRAAFMLPKIRWEGDEYKSKIGALREYCNTDFLRKILEQIDSGEDIDFWRR